MSDGEGKGKSREDEVREAMDALGMDEFTANFYVAIARGETDGDDQVVDGPAPPEPEPEPRDDS